VPVTNNEPTLSPKAFVKTILDTTLASKLTAAGLPAITIKTDSWFSMKNQKVPQIVLTNLYEDTQSVTMNPSATYTDTTSNAYILVHILAPDDDTMWRLLKVIRGELLVNANNGTDNPEWGSYGYKFIKISSIQNTTEPIGVQDKEGFFGEGFKGNTIGGSRIDIELTIQWDNA